MTYIRCPHCGAKALNVATVCPQCREPLSQNPMDAARDGMVACRRCRKFVERDTETCAFCGYQVRRGRRIRLVSAAVGAALLLGAGAVWWVRTGGLSPSGVTPPLAPIATDAIAALDTALPVPTLPPVAARVAGPAPAANPVTQTRWTRNWANVRAGRSRDSSVVGILRPGVTVEVMNPGGGWWAVWRGGALFGYVAADLLQVAAPDSLS